jgi:hypothetical protein
MTAMSSMPGMMPGAMPGMGQPGQPQDFNKLFLAEKENVMITPHVWDLDDIEERLLKKYGKTFKSTTAPTVAAAASKKSIPETSTKKEPTVRDKIKAAQKNSGNSKRR